MTSRKWYALVLTVYSGAYDDYTQEECILCVTTDKSLAQRIRDEIGHGEYHVNPESRAKLMDILANYQLRPDLGKLVGWYEKTWGSWTGYTDMEFFVDVHETERAEWTTQEV